MCYSAFICVITSTLIQRPPTLALLFFLLILSTRLRDRPHNKAVWDSGQGKGGGWIMSRKQPLSFFPTSDLDEGLIMQHKKNQKAILLTLNLCMCIYEKKLRRKVDIKISKAESVLFHKKKTKCRKQEQHLKIRPPFNKNSTIKADQSLLGLR